MLKPDDFELYLRSLNESYGRQLNYCLLHDLSFISEIPHRSFVVLEKFLNECKSVKFGVSIYTFAELIEAIKKFNRVSLVQAPLNYFDRRFISDEFLAFCIDKDIDVNYRSIFLQGKLLNSFDLLNPYFQDFIEFRSYYSDFRNSKCGSFLKFNIDFIKTATDFSKVVIGLESANQVIEIIRLIKEKNSQIKLAKISDIKFNENLCIPMKWKLV